MKDESSTYTSLELYDEENQTGEQGGRERRLRRGGGGGGGGVSGSIANNIGIGDGSSPLKSLANGNPIVNKHKYKHIQIPAENSDDDDDEDADNKIRGYVVHDNGADDSDMNNRGVARERAYEKNCDDEDEEEYYDVFADENSPTRGQTSKTNDIFDDILEKEIRRRECIRRCKCFGCICLLLFTLCGVIAVYFAAAYLYDPAASATSASPSAAPPSPSSSSSSNSSQAQTQSSSSSMPHVQPPSSNNDSGSNSHNITSSNSSKPSNTAAHETTAKNTSATTESKTGNSNSNTNTAATTATTSSSSNVSDSGAGNGAADTSSSTATSTTGTATTKPNEESSSSSSMSQSVLTFSTYQPMDLSLPTKFLISDSTATAAGTYISSISMSDDGRLLALAYNHTSASVFKYYAGGQQEPQTGNTTSASSSIAWRHVSMPVAGHDAGVSQVRLSGDGTTLVVAFSAASTESTVDTLTKAGITDAESVGHANYDYFLQPMAKVIHSWNGNWEKQHNALPDLRLVEPTDGEMDDTSYIPVDFAISRNGSMCVVGSGANWTTTATYGDGATEWADNDFRNVQVNVLPCTLGDWGWEDGTINQVSRFPNEYNSDNFGFAVDMSGDGYRAVATTEHDQQQHVANFVVYSEPDHNYYGTVDGAIVLNRNRICKKEYSDVATSDDGDLVVMLVQCWNDAKNNGDGGEGMKVTYNIHTFAADKKDVDGGSLLDVTYSQLNHFARDQKKNSEGSNSAFPSESNDYIMNERTFSVELSGNGKTLAVSRPGVFELFELDEKNTWKTVERIQLDNTSFQVALSQDGSRMAVVSSTMLMDSKNHDSNEASGGGNVARMTTTSFGIYEKTQQ